MKRLIISVLVIGFVLLLASCATKRKSMAELKGLMLLDNTQLPRNRALYSKNNIKTKNLAYRKYRKNSRNL